MTRRDSQRTAFASGGPKWDKTVSRGQPAYSLPPIQAEAGLIVKSAIDNSLYETGVKVSDEELAAVAVHPHDFHGEWNYTIRRKKKI